ncbi:MAG: BrnA antitoxin family protein [Pyrinomonadaceae bacterium]
MKKTEKNNVTSAEAKKAGLKRIDRKHKANKGETSLSDCKVRITINLDADVLEYFKQRAESPNAAPYQTQINAELRKIMGRDSGEFLDSTANNLLQDENFIAALKDKLKAA